MGIDYFQILLLVVQCILVSVLILALFRVRTIFSISLLYAMLGLFQYMQSFLASTVYFEVAPNVLVSPGSSVLFVGSLFAVLLVYIKEDALETRKIIYALLFSNIVMSILLFLFSWHIDKSNIFNPLNVSLKFFNSNAWLLLVGTITLWADAFLIIVLYEFVSKYLGKIFLRIYITMMLVLSFDAVSFSLLGFWNFDNLRSILFSGLIAKNASVVIYSFMFYLYLKFIEKDNYKITTSSFKDVFYALSYKQKFEIEKEQSEKVINESKIKYRTLIENSPVGIFLTKSDGYTTYVNPKWCEISGMSKEKAIGDGWLEAVHPNDKQQIGDGWKLASSKHYSSFAEYRFLRNDGTIRWVLGQAIPEINPEGAIIGYVGTITDITELKVYEKELKIAKEKAEESDRLKTAFLHNISHEIRTPLNAICGFSDFLKDDKLPVEKRIKFISIINDSSNQLLSIVSDIIAISAIETKQEEISINKVNVNLIIEELFVEFKQFADNKRIELINLVALQANEAEINTDRAKLVQILRNLLSNAIKFTNSGYVKFGYKLNDAEFEFFVEDTGIGIKSEAYEKIFESFVQADEDIQVNFGGTGLGLSIAKGYVNLLGSKLVLKSTYGEGSIFSFLIKI